MYGKKGKRAEIAARIRDLKQAIEQDTKGASTLRGHDRATARPAAAFGALQPGARSGVASSS